MAQTWMESMGNIRTSSISWTECEVNFIEELRQIDIRFHVRQPMRNISSAGVRKGKKLP
jgi:hypothetical protein